MKYSFKILSTILVLFVFLTGCASVEEVSKDTVTKVEQAFKSESPEANIEHENISYYLPDDMKIDKKGKNDFILSKGEQLYILFVNPNESINSEVLYEGIVSPNETFAINETFKDKERFGYIKASEIDDKNYLISVGIGGIKMTTESTLKDVPENAEQMMKIVSSLQY